MNNNLIITIIFHCLMALSVQSFDYNEGISNFASDLYQNCANESINKNIIISPLSVANALTLLSQGARKNTFEQIARGLHLNDVKFTIATDFAKHFETLNERAGNASLSIANQLYLSDGFQIKKQFHDVAVNQFKSGVESLDFEDSVSAAATINSFVEHKTNNKIKNLIPPNALGPDTRLVLVNAIHFKGDWRRKFRNYRTSSQNFFIDETNTNPVDFMRNNGEYKYAELNNLDAKVLELEYKHSNISFVAILPNKRTGLPALEAALQNYDLSKITSQMTEEYVDITIPKFKIEYQIDLEHVLQKLGMIDMFGDNADLKGIIETNEPLKVSKAIHKAFIEVNEDGTEAAAATGMVAIPLSASIGSPMGKVFRADHPFLFYIMDIQQNTIIFSGRFKR